MSQTTELSSGPCGAPQASLHLNGVQLTDLAFAPNGAYFALAGKDGVLRIYSYPTGDLVAGFKSYYGSLLCCTWSVDSQYVATGGEDDLVSVFGMTDGCVVAWGEGHTSYISRVKFDSIQERNNQALNRRLAMLHHTHAQRQAASKEAPQEHLPATHSEGFEYPSGQQLYRIVSVGHDCQMGFWDLVIADDGGQQWLARTPNRVGSSTGPLNMLDHPEPAQATAPDRPPASSPPHRRNKKTWGSQGVVV